MNKKTGKKSWLHPPNRLTDDQVIYQVKFLGNVTVAKPKGADLVKEAIRKVKFNQQLKRAEGNKPRKVELTISTKALGIQEKQNKISLHSFPLQHISYCADDKTDKKICAFIARNDLTQTHECFVLESEKAQAEDITLTVGQAFDLAYQAYKDNLNRDPASAMKKLKHFQEKIQTLEAENKNLRARVAELEEKLGITPTPEQSKERTDSTSSTNSQPFVFQLDSFGGTSSTDPVDPGDEIEKMFGPSLDLAPVNGTTASDQDNRNGEIMEDPFKSPEPQQSIEVSSSSPATPVIAPPPRPARQKRRQPPPSLLASTNNNGEAHTSPSAVTAVPVVPANTAPSTNPFQDDGDWTQSFSSQPPALGSGELIFNTQEKKPQLTSTLDPFDPFAS